MHSPSFAKSYVVLLREGDECHNEGRGVGRHIERGGDKEATDAKKGGNADQHTGRFEYRYIQTWRERHDRLGLDLLLQLISDYSPTSSTLASHPTSTSAIHLHPQYIRVLQLIPAPRRILLSLHQSDRLRSRLHRIRVMTRCRRSKIRNVGVLLAEVLSRLRKVLLRLKVLQRRSLRLLLKLVVLEVLLAVRSLRLTRPRLIRLRFGLSLPSELGFGFHLPLSREGGGGVVGEGEVAAGVELTRANRLRRRRVRNGESLGGNGDGDALRGELVSRRGRGSLRGASGDGEDRRARKKDGRIAVEA